MNALLAAPVIPLLAVAIVIGLRAPTLLLALYAFVVPWGSAYAVPIGLPPAFSSVSTLAGLAASVGVLTHIVATRHRAREVLPTMPIALALLGATAVTIDWSIDRPTTVDELLVLGSLIALFVVVSLVEVTPRDLRIFEHAALLGGVLVGLRALVELLTGTLPTTGAGVPRFEMPGGGGENGDPNITAATLLLPLFIALAYGLREQRGWRRLAYLGAAGVIAVAVVLTISRGAMVAFVVGAFILGMARASRRQVVAILVVPVVIGAAVFLSAPAELRNHLFVSGSSGRTGVWDIGLKACRQHCLTGTGWGTFPDVHEEVLLDTPSASGTRLRYVAHNIWLQAGVEGGVLVLLLLVALFAAAFVGLRRLPPEVRGPPMAALLALAITNTFLSNLDFKYFWVVMLYASMARLAYGHTRSPGVPAALRPALAS